MTKEEDKTTEAEGNISKEGTMLGLSKSVKVVFKFLLSIVLYCDRVALLFPSINSIFLVIVITK